MASASPPSVDGYFQSHMPLPIAGSRSTTRASAGRGAGSSASGTSTAGRHRGPDGGRGGAGGGGQPAIATGPVGRGAGAGGDGGGTGGGTGATGAAMVGLTPTTVTGDLAVRLLPAAWRPPTAAAEARPATRARATETARGRCTVGPLSQDRRGGLGRGGNVQLDARPLQI